MEVFLLDRVPSCLSEEKMVTGTQRMRSLGYQRKLGVWMGAAGMKPRPAIRVPLQREVC